MAEVDLHGIEVLSIPSPRPPLGVGTSSVVGLIGSAPDAAGTPASLTVGAGNAAFTVTADAVGEAGDDITVAVTRVSGAGKLLTVIVAGTDIVIQSDDGGGGTFHTATEIVAGINADAEASALVTAALADGSTGVTQVAAAAAMPLAGGVDAGAPLDRPKLLETAAEVQALGSAGSLPEAVRDVLRTAGRNGATIVVVRTADDTPAKLAGTKVARTGVYALLDAESETGQRPRLLAAPGARDAVVTTALQAAADDLHAIAVVTIEAATAAAAIVASPDLSHVLACWPELVVTDGTAQRTRPADGLVIGHIVRTDREASFSASPSNRLLSGVVRTARAVGWGIDSRDSIANTLSRGNVATAVRRGSGVYFWGNRMSDGGFIARRRADDIISDQVAEAALDYLDRRVDLPFVEHILGRLNGYLRTLTINGHIRAGRAWFDPAYNTADTLAAAQVTFSYEITPHDIAEHIIFSASVGGIPNEILAGLAQEA